MSKILLHCRAERAKAPSTTPLRWHVAHGTGVRTFPLFRRADGEIGVSKTPFQCDVPNEIGVSQTRVHGDLAHAIGVSASEHSHEGV